MQASVRIWVGSLIIHYHIGSSKSVKSQRTSFSFQLPEGYVVEAAPASGQLDLPFAYYRSEITVEADNTLRYVAVYDIKKLEVAAADFPELRKFFDLVERASRAVVILKRSQ